MRNPDQRFDSPRFSGGFAPAASEDGTIGLVWHTGPVVEQHGSYSDREGNPRWGRYDLQLSMDPSAVRLGRLNGHAPLLRDHNADSVDAVIGKVVPGSAAVVEGVGVARVQLSDTPGDAEVVAKIRSGLLRNVSVGAKLHAFVRADAVEAARPFPLFFATDWEPMEISAVSLGADPNAHTLSLTPDQEPPAMTTALAPAGAMTATELLAAQSEIRAAGRVLAGTDDALVARLCETADKVTLADARKAILDRRIELDAATATSGAHRTQLTGGRVTLGLDESEARGAAIEASLLARVGLGAQLADSANAYVRQYRNRSLSEICQIELSRRGFDVAGLSRTELADAAFTQLRSEDGHLGWLRASGGGAMSSSDFPYLLANTARKALRAGYEAANIGDWRQFCYRDADFADYKSRSTIMLGDVAQLQELPEGASPLFGDMLESATSMRVVDYAAGLAITRVAIANDDLRGLTEGPRKFGASSEQKQAALVAALVEGGTLNVVANTSTVTTAPSVAALSDMRLKMARRTGLAATGETGPSLGTPVAMLVVPPELFTAAQQVTGDIVPALATSVNPFTGLRVVQFSGLSSAVKWYGFANPSMLPAIRYAYLSGEGGPVIDSDVEWGSGSLKLKCRLAFALGADDNRGIVYNPGA